VGDSAFFLFASAAEPLRPLCVPEMVRHGLRRAGGEERTSLAGGLAGPARFTRTVPFARRPSSSGSPTRPGYGISGSPQGRLLALQGTRRWGRAAMVGEGNIVNFDVSQTIIHNQITIYGSWVTSTKHMEDLVEKLVEWDLKPEVIVSHRFTLDQAAEAYRVADEGQSGKVCIVME